jgi:uncharacterized protein (UPF0276 family)
MIFGLGFRHEYGAHIHEQQPALGFLEVITENFLEPGGRPRQVLRALRERYPIVCHGVSLSIAATDPLDELYLQKLDRFVRELEPSWVSDHLCFTRHGGHNSHDLLPVPYTEEAVGHVVARIQTVQDRLHRPLVLENLSNYLAFVASEMEEQDFFAEVIARSGCRMLLDVNNVFVSSFNLGRDPLRFLAGIPLGAVQQIHLAGHEDKGRYLFDTHDRDVRPEVLALYRAACERFGPVPTMIERDGNFPEFSVLYDELMQAKAICDEVTSGAAARASSAVLPFCD